MNSNRALCVQPQLFVEGYIRFEVAIGNGNYKWKGKFFIGEFFFLFFIISPSFRYGSMKKIYFGSAPVFVPPKVMAFLDFRFNFE